MSAAVQYTPQTDFSQDEANLVQGRSTVRTAELDTELSNIALSIASLITKATAVVRDDDVLRDNVVSVASLSSAVLALIGGGAFTINAAGTNWLTATVYVAGNIVTQGTGTYVAAVNHTSGVFATDYTAGKWYRIFDTAAFTAAGVTFTPTGTIAAANVQAAIAEVASEALQKALNLSDVGSASTSLANLGGASIVSVQTSAATYSAGFGTASAFWGAYTPVPAALVDGMTLEVEAVGANVSTTPTFTPSNGVIAAQVIKKRNAQALAPGDIAGAGHTLVLRYHSSGTYWELLNPALSTASTETQGSDITTLPSGVATLPAFGAWMEVTVGGTISSFAGMSSGRSWTLHSQLGNTIVHDGVNIVLQQGVSSTLSAGEVISFRSIGGIAYEVSRRDLPARVRTAVRLALSALTR